jgi:ketosteroid isomerase-like protein
MIPDIRVVPIRWGETADGVFIEWRNTGTLDGTPFEIRGVDLYTLRDGKGSEGISYFDPRMGAQARNGPEHRSWPVV